MRAIFIAYAGPEDALGRLTDDGRRWMRRAGGYIRPQFGSRDNVLVLTGSTTHLNAAARVLKEREGFPREHMSVVDLNNTSVGGAALYEAMMYIPERTTGFAHGAQPARKGLALPAKKTTARVRRECDVLIIVATKDVGLTLIRKIATNDLGGMTPAVADAMYYFRSGETVHFDLMRLQISTSVR